MVISKNSKLSEIVTISLVLSRKMWVLFTLDSLKNNSFCFKTKTDGADGVFETIFAEKDGKLKTIIVNCCQLVDSSELFHLRFQQIQSWINFRRMV